MSEKHQERISLLLPSPAITHFPSPIMQSPTQLTNEEQVNRIAEHFKEIMTILGLDLNDDSLSQTPFRIAKMYLEEFFWGLKEENFPSIHFFNHNPQTSSLGDFVFVKASFTSFCEHHFVPMIGFAYVAYLPDHKWMGLSNIPRLVRFFASRPQLQERLTAQVADSLALLLETEDVAVAVHAQHDCVIARGVQDQHNLMITHVLRGKFQTEGKMRQEFFEGIKNANSSS